MPTYDFRCEDCGQVSEHYASMEEREKPCQSCGGTTNRLITSRIYLQTDYATRDFVTPDITGSEVRITSRKQLRKLCKDNGVRPMEGEHRSETLARRQDNLLTDRWV